MGRTQLNIRMDDGEKSEWKEYVKKSRWDDSTTDFVKRAVREKIERMDDGDGDTTPDFDIGELATDTAASGEVIERIQNLQNNMRSLTAEVGDALDAVHAQQGINPDASPDVYETLPTGEDDAMTVDEISKRTGHRQATVRFALENMRRTDGLGVSKRVEMEDHERGVVEWVDGDSVDSVAAYETEADPQWYKQEGA